MRLGGHTLDVTLDPTQPHGVVPGVRGEASLKFCVEGNHWRVWCAAFPSELLGNANLTLPRLPSDLNSSSLTKV
jgi:hypothetical protein